MVIPPPIVIQTPDETTVYEVAAEFWQRGMCPGLNGQLVHQARTGTGISGHLYLSPLADARVSKIRGVAEPKGATLKLTLPSITSSNN